MYYMRKYLLVLDKRYIFEPPDKIPARNTSENIFLNYQRKYFHVVHEIVIRILYRTVS